MNSTVKKIKLISGKRQKTEADFAEMAKLEWFGGLYLNKGKPCIPGEVLEATIINGARKSKRGKLAEQTVYCLDNYDLQYDGGRPPSELWEDDNYRFVKNVRIGQATVMRTRPIFREWSSDIEVTFDDGVLNPADVKEIVKTAGESVGLMEWRPRFGRFEVVE